MVGDTLVGLLCCLVAGVGFGSNYLPVKQVQVADGVFFSAMMSIGILVVGTLVNFTVACEEYSLAPHRPPQFEPIAAIGGVLWMLGNLLCPIIVQWLGLGLGLAVWDCGNLITGWATGKFGLFGVWKEEVPSETMNSVGVILACVSLVLFAFAGDDPEPQAKDAEEGNHRDPLEDPEAGKDDLSRVCTTSTACTTTPSTPDEETPTEPTEPCAEIETNPQVECLSDIPEAACATPSATSVVCSQPSSAALSRALQARHGMCTLPWHPWRDGIPVSHQRQIGGFVLAMLTGFCFGLTFDLPTDLMQLGRLGENHSTNPMDYVFSHFCGIAATGAAALLVYGLVMRSQSYTPKKVILPAVMSGIIWGIAQVAWFEANVKLSLVVAFPIISTLPGIIGMAWGYFLFGEFNTPRSRRLAALGMLIRIPAVALIACSGTI